jgi:hypothetical protein
VDDLLDFLQRFLTRHGLRRAAISVQIHEGHVVRVAHSISAPFPPPDASLDGRTLAPEDGSDHWRLARARLTPGEINARLGTRLNRLLRHFAVRFGALHIEVDEEGAINTTAHDVNMG